MHIKQNYLAAVEAGCGGKLYGIGVENDDVSKQLLTRKCFDYFVQFFPLNTLNYRQIPEEVIQTAKAIANKHNKAEILLPWSPEVSSPSNPHFKAIHLFCTSTFLICTNNDAAAEIAKSRKVPVPIVTLDGDLFDPSGEASGGFRGDRDSIPRKWFLYQQMLEEREKTGAETARLPLLTKLENLENERSTLLSKRDDYRKQQSRLEVVTASIRSLQSRLTHDAASKFAAQLPILSEQEDRERKELEAAKEELQAALELLEKVRKGKDVKQALVEGKKRVELEKVEVVKQVEEARRQLAEACSVLQAEQKEIEEIQKAIKELEKSVEQLGIFIEERSRYLEAEEFKIEEQKKAFEEKLQRQKERQEEDEGRKQLQKELQINIDNTNQEIENLNRQITTLKGDLSGARLVLRDDPSILDTPFQRDDQLERVDPIKIEKELTSIKQQIYDLDKQINKDVESQKNRLEEQMLDLANKENILKQDKDQIYTNLEHLDEKSQQSVVTCFEFVNQ
jgi:structural maintenance of chromosome 2